MSICRQKEKVVSTAVDIAFLLPNSKCVFCVSNLHSLLGLPRPSTAWSQEVLHNSTQDLVKVFMCVFTNNSAAGFQATTAKRTRAGILVPLKSRIM